MFSAMWGLFCHRNSCASFPLKTKNPLVDTLGEKSAFSKGEVHLPFAFTPAMKAGLPDLLSSKPSATQTG